MKNVLSLILYAVTGSGFEPFDTVRALSNLIPVLHENECKYLILYYESIYRTSPSYCLMVWFTLEGGMIHDTV